MFVCLLIAGEKMYDKCKPDIDSSAAHRMIAASLNIKLPKRTTGSQKSGSAKTCASREESPPRQDAW